MSADDRLGPSATPMVWIGLERCNVCCIAVPSRIPRVASMPSMTMSPAATCVRAWAMSVPTGGSGVDGVTIAASKQSGVGEFLDGLAAELGPVVSARSRCGGCISPSRASRARPGRWYPHRALTGW